jgi:phosphohistidine phosphatase
VLVEGGSAGVMRDETARRLMLLRHAKSAWPDDVADHDRPLARRGRRDAPAAGRWLRKSGNVPGLVLCSTARRARETCELALHELGGDPPVTYEQQVYGATAAELLTLARQTPSAIAAVLIVGHDPAMQSLTLELASGQPGDADAAELERVRAKFPTAAIAVLAFTGAWPDLGPGQARLASFARPGDLPPR